MTPLPAGLRHALFWIAAAAFAFAEIALLVGTFRSGGSHDTGARGRRLGALPERLLALVPVLLTSLLLIAAWHAVAGPP